MTAETAPAAAAADLDPVTAPLPLVLLVDPAPHPDADCDQCFGTGATGPHETESGRWIMRACYACELRETPIEELFIPLGVREVMAEIRSFLRWARTHRGRGEVTRGRHHRGAHAAAPAPLERKPEDSPFTGRHDSPKVT